MSALDVFRTNPVPRTREAYNASMAKWCYKRELALSPCHAIVVYNAPAPAPKRVNPIGAQLWNLTSIKALPAPASPAPYMPSRGAEIEDRMYLTQYEWNAGGMKRRLQ